MADGIREYGITGKFGGGYVMDEHIYELFGAGADEQAGDIDERGTWHGLLRGDLDCPTGIVLTPEERSFLRAQVGVIMCEDAQGFVYVDYFDDAHDMESMWSRVVSDYAGRGDDPELTFQVFGDID